MDNAKTIEEHNAKHLGWTMDVNEYADLSWEEFKTLKVGGFRPDLARQPWKLHGHLSYAEEAACQSFLCRRNASQASSSPAFVRQEVSRYIFNFETPLACLPESVDCLISDMNGNQYDLSPLAKDAGNWEAVDTRPNYKGLSYHINVCRPINKGDPATSSCPGNVMVTTGRACFCKSVSRSLLRAAANSCDSLRFDMAVARVRPPCSCVPEKNVHLPASDARIFCEIRRRPDAERCTTDARPVVTMVLAGV